MQTPPQHTHIHTRTHTSARAYKESHRQKYKHARIKKARETDALMHERIEPEGRVVLYPTTLHYSYTVLPPNHPRRRTNKPTK